LAFRILFNLLSRGQRWLFSKVSEIITIWTRVITFVFQRTRIISPLPEIIILLLRFLLRGLIALNRIEVAKGILLYFLGLLFFILRLRLRFYLIKLSKVVVFGI